MDSATPTFPIWVRYTYRQVDGIEVCDTFGYTDRTAAEKAGAAMKANPVFPGLGFMVLPLQAAPAAA